VNGEFKQHNLLKKMSLEQLVTSVTQQIKVRIGKVDSLQEELFNLDKEIAIQTAKRNQALLTLKYHQQVVSNWNSILYSQLRTISQQQKTENEALVVERSQTQERLANLGHLIQEFKGISEQGKSKRARTERPCSVITNETNQLLQDFLQQKTIQVVSVPDM
jgi:hypothetical protein